MKIEKANIKDARPLTELTTRLKSYWDYSQQQLQDWKEDLTVSENYITNKEVYKLISNKCIIGYYSFFKSIDGDLKLENLFIEPNFIGRGIGKMLMIDFFKRVQEMEFGRIILDADPHAEMFYAKLRFKLIGKLETSIENRFLPIMAMDKSGVQDFLKVS